LTCPKTTTLGTAIPHRLEGGPEGQAASLSYAGSWPWVGPAQLRCWCCSLVLPKKKSQRTHRPAPRTMPGAAAVYLRKEEYLLS